MKNIKFFFLFLALLTAFVLLLKMALKKPETYDTLKVGITSGPQTHIMATVKQKAREKHNLNVEIIEFTNYALPNEATASGDIDANLFQHIAFLNEAIQKNKYPFQIAAKTFIYPMGLYSQKITLLSELKPGSVVAIPSDPSNGGRALLLLQSAKIITLKPEAGVLATVQDIKENPLNLDIKTLEAAQLPRIVPDVDLVALNNDFVEAAQFKTKDALFKENPEDAEPYVNVLVIHEKNKDNPKLQKLIDILHSQDMVALTQEYFPGALPAWKTKPL
jgi:D-methionine transport system substrate-binding protein